MARIGLEGDSISLIMSGFINIVQLLAVLPAMFLLDSLGRKPLLRGMSPKCDSDRKLKDHSSGYRNDDIVTPCSRNLGMVYCEYLAVH